MGTRLAAVTVVLMCCCAAPADDAEDRAIAAVEKLGGSCRRDDKKPNKPVVAVYLQEPKVTDADLKELAPLLTAFKELTALDLAQTQVAEKGLKEVGALK